MWQLIAKGIAGGIGGGLKAAGETSKTNTSGEFQETGNQQNEEDTGSSVGGIVGKLAKKIKDKKSSEGK